MRTPARPRFTSLAIGSTSSPAASVFTGGDQVNSPFSTSAFGINDHSLWLYGNVSPVPMLRLTLGGNFDQLHTTTNGADLLSLTQFNPKVGVSWDVLPNTILRAAYFEILKRPLIGDLSIVARRLSPLRLAVSTSSLTTPLGQRPDPGVSALIKVANSFLASDLLSGAEWSQRQLNVPLAIDTESFELGWREG